MVNLRSSKAFVIVLVVVLLCAAGWKKYKGKTEDAGPGTVKVERGDIELHFMDSGELTPKTFVDVASKVSGRVIELFVDEGARVRKGEKLAVIQPGRTEAEAYVPTTLTAPIDGVVMRYQDRSSNNAAEGRLSKLGEYVTGLMESQNPTYLMTVADLSRLIVKMKISEMDILKLKEGMDVKVTVDALPGYDAAISESHHALKKDAPSGSAKRLAEAVRDARKGGAPVPTVSLRAGGIVGDHTFFLAGPGERLELTHRADSRDVFARGALDAALWLRGRRPGFYTVRDMLSVVSHGPLH